MYEIISSTTHKHQPYKHSSPAAQGCVTAFYKDASCDSSRPQILDSPVTCLHNYSPQPA